MQNIVTRVQLRGKLKGGVENKGDFKTIRQSFGLRSMQQGPTVLATEIE